jgi:hypothetical protein
MHTHDPGEIVDRTPIPGQLELAIEPAAPATLFGTDDPAAVIAKATAISDELARVIHDKKLYARISGKEHVLVEGWTLLGSMLGLFPYTVWTRRLEDGWEARVEARTVGGRPIAAAEAECLRAERKWARSDDYAIRSMAQTRAVSKALRQPLGFVMQLAGFDACPADEVATHDPGRVAPTTETSRVSNSQRHTIAQLFDRLATAAPAVDWRRQCAAIAGPSNELSDDDAERVIKRMLDWLAELESGEVAITTVQTWSDKKRAVT